MGCVTVLIALAALTALTAAQPVNESISQAPFWRWAYMQVYPSPPTNETAGDLKSLYFALMMSFGGSYKSSGAVPAVQTALDEINNRPDLLPGYKLHYTLTDSHCNRTVALDAFFKQIFQDPVKISFIGSGCSVATEPTAEISHFYNITQFSCTSSSTELANPQRFHYYFQLISTEADIAPGFFGIIKHFKWKKVAIFQQDENLFTVTMNKLKILLEEEGIRFNEIIFKDFEELHRHQFDPETRIIIISSYAVHARQLLCKAYKSQLFYPRYMFLTFAWYVDRWWEGEEEDPEDGCTPEQRESVLNYTLAPLQFEFIDDYNATTDTGINGNQYEDMYAAHQNSSELDIDKNETYLYGQHCYDATWALALALNRTITELEENTTLNDEVWKAAGLQGNGTFSLDHFSYNNSALLNVILRHVRETKFNGITGNVSFGSNHIRNVSRLQVYQYRCNADGVLEKVEIGDVLGDDYQFVYLPGEEEKSWPGGIIPYDGVPLEEVVTISIYITVGYSILAAAGILFAVVCLAFICTLRTRKLTHLSSSKLDYLIVGGAIILYMHIYFLLIPTTDPMVVVILCNVIPWLSALGYSLCYGPILARMFRDYYIYRTQKQYPLQDRYLALGVLLLVMVDLVILLLYTIVEGAQGNLTATQVPRRGNAMDVEGELDIITLYFYYVCSSTGRDIFLGILCGYKIVLQVFALLLAFSSRKVKVKGLNDAKYTAAAIYITSPVSAVIIVSIYSLKEFLNAIVTLRCTGLIVGTTLILGLVFVPKMIDFHKDKRMNLKTNSAPPQPQGIHNGQHVGAMNTEVVSNLRKRIMELETTLSLKNQTETLSCPSPPNEAKAPQVTISFIGPISTLNSTSALYTTDQSNGLCTAD